MRSIGKNITLYPKIGKAYYQKNNTPYEILSKYVTYLSINQFTIADGFGISDYKFILIDDFILIFEFKFTIPTSIESDNWYTFLTINDFNTFHSIGGRTTIYQNLLSNNESYKLRDLYLMNNEFKIYLTTSDGGYKGNYQGITVLI